MKSVLQRLSGQQPRILRMMATHKKDLGSDGPRVSKKMLHERATPILGAIADGSVPLDEAGADWFPELRAELAAMIASESAFVDPFFRNIIDARIDETSIEPLLIRADIWANRWNDAYNLAKLKIQSLYGERLVWRMGNAEHCDTCQSLNGIVAFAHEWEQLNVRPQNPPNPLLICQGWRCKCSLNPTSQRRSPKAFDMILNIVGRI